MLRVRVVSVVLASLSLSLFAPSTARAEEPSAPKKDSPPDDFKHVSVTANPLSLLLRRVGLNIEYLPVPHHGVMINPYFASGTASDDSSGTKVETKAKGFGGELAYRFYSGSEGANGFFIGPGIILARSQLHSTRTAANGASSSADVSVFSYGGFIDVGGQLVTRGGFTLGAGTGIGYVFSDVSNVATSRSVKVSGVLPRVLFTLGYSF